MYWQDSFFFDTTNAADTYETIATSPSNNTVLQSLIVHNKHSGGIVFDAKLVYLDTSDWSTTTDIILFDSVNLGTKTTFNLCDAVTGLGKISIVPGSFSIPEGSYIQIKSDTISTIDVMCTLRTYSEDRFEALPESAPGFTTTSYSNF